VVKQKETIAPRKKRNREHYGLDAGGVSILQTALHGKVLTTKSDICLVGVLIGAKEEVITRWLQDQAAQLV